MFRRKKYENSTVKELRRKAKKLGLRGYVKMKKEELVDLMERENIVDFSIDFWAEILSSMKSPLV